MDDPLFLMNGRRIEKESCPNPNDHSNYPPTVLRSCNRIKSFIRKTNASRSMIVVRDTNKRTNTTRCTISRECIKRAKKNIFNDTKNTRAQIYKIYQRTATSCSLCYLNEEIISSSSLY